MGLRWFTCRKKVWHNAGSVLANSINVFIRSRVGSWFWFALADLPGLLLAFFAVFSTFIFSVPTCACYSTGLVLTRTFSLHYLIYRIAFFSASATLVSAFPMPFPLYPVACGAFREGGLLLLALIRMRRCTGSASSGLFTDGHSQTGPSPAVTRDLGSCLLAFVSGCNGVCYTGLPPPSSRVGLPATRRRLVGFWFLAGSPVLVYF